MDDKAGNYGIRGYIPPQDATHIIAACGITIEDLLMEAAKADPLKAIELGKEGFADHLRATDPTFNGLYQSAELLLKLRVEEIKRMSGGDKEAAPKETPTDSFAQPFTFGGALHALKRGHFVARTGWNGKDMYIGLQNPTSLSQMSLPYIFMRTVQGDLVPWLASQTDMLSNDWVIV